MIASVAAGQLLVAPANADTITYIEDDSPDSSYQHVATTLWQNNPDQNDGADTLLRLGRAHHAPVGQSGFPGNLRTILTFYLANIPAGSTIDSISLTLFTDSREGSPGDVNLHTLAGATPVVEGTGVYPDGPNDGVTWNSPGGAVATLLSSAPPSLGGAPMTFISTPAFVAAAQSAFDANDPLQTIMIAPFAEATGVSDFYRFASDDSSDPALRPSLTVTFTEQVDPDQCAQLYWSAVPDRSIKRSNLDGTGVTTILSGANNRFGGIDFDATNGHLYSGDRTAVFRANLDGSGRVNLVAAVNQVADVELDLANQKIYWSEGGGGVNAIYRANMDGTDRQVLVNEGFNGGLEGIALDLSAGKLYFCHDVNTPNERIRVMNLDGSGQAVVHHLAGPNSGPFDVEIDQNAGILYWVHVNDDHLMTSDLVGGAPQIVAAVPTLNNGFHFDALDQKFYVAALGLGIQRLNADGTGLQLIVPEALSGSVNYIAVLHTDACEEDTTPPEITFCPADVTVPWSDSYPPETTGGSATATDDTDPSPVVTSSDSESGTCPTTITRTWTATDAAGNSSTCEQIITVENLFAADSILWHQPLARSGMSEDTDPSANGTLKYRFKLGSTIPIKVHALGCGGPVTANANVTGRVVVFGDTDMDGTADAGELPIDYNGVGEAGGFMDKIDGHLRYNLDTKKLPATVKCYILQVTVIDSSTGELGVESIPLQAK